MELVTLNTFSNSFEAEVVKGRLIAEGIEAYVFYNNVHVGLTAELGYRLQVRKEDFMRANNIYQKALKE